MKEKGFLGLLLGLGSYIIGHITMVTVVFFSFMMIDMVSGFLGSKVAGESYDPEKAWKGVAKKAGYLIFWLLGVLVEIIIAEQGASIGIEVSIPVVSLAVTFWLLGTEGMSILYNLDKMGVKGIPSWFTKYFDKMQQKTDQ